MGFAAGTVGFGNPGGMFHRKSAATAIVAMAAAANPSADILIAVIF
jgi:hypothetical protein